MYLKDICNLIKTKKDEKNITPYYFDYKYTFCF